MEQALADAEDSAARAERRSSASDEAARSMERVADALRLEVDALHSAAQRRGGRVGASGAERVTALEGEVRSLDAEAQGAAKQAYRQSRVAD